jgi:uncharacterized RDD family membrane protein YckC
MELQEDLLTEIETELNQEPVSAGIRFADYMIDLVIFYILAVIAGLVLRPFIVEGGRPVLYLVSYILYLSYFTLMEGATNGRSIGKIITRSKAVKEDGAAITWSDAFLRSLSRIVPFEPFSAFGGHPWHDRWTHTKVVKSR